MSKPRVKFRRLICTAVDFVEVELPQPITPRLVIQFSEGMSILLEGPDDILFASELVAAMVYVRLADPSRRCIPAVMFDSEVYAGVKGV